MSGDQGESEVLGMSGSLCEPSLRILHRATGDGVCEDICILVA